MRRLGIGERLWAGAVVTAAAVLMAPGNAGTTGSDTLAGPVPAQVLRVLDGDTIEVRARLWLDQSLETAVRLRGVDAPEIRGRCEVEVMLARRAKEFIEGKITNADVMLYDIQHDKYSRRVVARVAGGGVTDLSAALIKAGHAVPYAGAARKPWC